MASLAAIRPDLLVGFAAELHAVGAGQGAEAAGQVVGQPGEQAQVGGSVELPGEATAVLKRYLPQARFADVENPSRFHCHSRVARAFRAGSVFLAGNAAHVCSPAEGHGMNAGLQDAANLAWRLALVHHGVASPALLDSYGQERRPVAQQICRSGDATEAAHGLREPAERAVRDRAIAALQAELEADRVAGTVPPALVEAVVAVRLEAAPSLGLGPLTLLAVRQDGFIGLRADADHLRAVRRDGALVLDGEPGLGAAGRLNPA